MRKVDLERWRKYAEHRNAGKSVGQAAKLAHLDASTAFRFEAGDQKSSGLEAMATLGVTAVGGVLVAPPLTKEAQDALEDFAAFRLRYFGRKSTPWQIKAVYETIRRLKTDEREYVVMNEPPGSGKSTLFTHDLPCWLIVRDRTIRIQLGSSTGRLARMYLGRIKRSLEREVPLKADAEDLANGRAFDAISTLQADYGAFKPERGDVWSAQQITVRQMNGVSVDDKEPTVSAWGADEKFLGGRFDFIAWDDLVTRANSGTKEAFLTLIEAWNQEMQTRLEPSGLLLLQGQRIAAEDLFSYCLKIMRDDATPKYAHIRFPAHDEARCTGSHDNLDPWPDSCLLDPWRLPWKELVSLRNSDRQTYEIQYQQTDGDGVASLVQKAWLEGGVDADGYNSPGCFDHHRPLGHVPLDGDTGWSMVSVDPSPANYWAVGWWIHVGDLHHLVDYHRSKMSSPEFLSLDLDTGKYSGLLEDIRLAGLEAGAPITDIVVEINAAQRWLLSQPHAVKWSKTFNITFVPHETNRNKNDPKYGVTSIADTFRQGLVRIPFGDPTARLKAGQYVHELTHWPDARTDDLVMMTWFALLASNNGGGPRRKEPPRMSRPDFMAGYHARGLAARKDADANRSRHREALLGAS